jgi:SPASM domain peptide maturase of grasp-with-spasm system
MIPLSKDDHFILSRECKVVSGATKALICDYGRRELFTIPRQYSHVITMINRNNLYDFYKELDADSKTQFNEFLEFLLGNEIGFITHTPDHFPAINEQWLGNEAILSNAIIDIGTSPYSYKHVITELATMGNPDLQIRIFRYAEISEIRSLLQLCILHRFRYVELHLTHIREGEENEIKQLIYDYASLSFIFLYGQKGSKSEEIKIQRDKLPPLLFGYIHYLAQELIDEHSCGIINLTNVNVGLNDIQVYYELKSHNGCLNKKVAIDKEGYIKNCPSMKEAFGHADEDNLSKIINSEAFRKKWHIKKDDINICRDCEYRYMCTDCRAFLQEPEDIYSKPLKCGYDPYTGEWKDWRTMKENLSGMEHYSFFPEKSPR